MKIAVNIKVRNPEWYWPKERLIDSTKKDSMSRKEWEMLNEDKIPKHSEEVDFEFKFDVKSYKDNRNSEYHLTINVSDNVDFTNPSTHNVIIKNVTVVGFIGDKEESYVVVSNELIHQFISAKKNANGRLYWYFYLKEDSDYVRLTDNIWISYSENEKINKQFERFVIEEDSNLKRRKFSGSFPVKALGNSITDF
jgi:hypothetical protein